MQIMIDIPQTTYNHVFDNVGISNIDLRNILLGISKSVVLPEGHGRLIILSEDAIKREQTSLSFSCQDWISEVGLSNATVAIIEGDKEE